jgi:hypothetical protein
MLLGLFALAPVKVLAACADYISSGDGDQPLTGRLIGQRTVAVSSTQQITGTFNTRLSGGSYQYQRTVTTTYEVGFYEMSDGTTRMVRCDSYTLA